MMMQILPRMQTLGPCYKAISPGSLVDWFGAKFSLPLAIKMISICPFHNAIIHSAIQSTEIHRGRTTSQTMEAFLCKCYSSGYSTLTLLSINKGQTDKPWFQHTPGPLNHCGNGSWKWQGLIVQKKVRQELQPWGINN